MASDRTGPAPEGRRWRRREGTGWRESLNGLVLMPPGADEPVTVAGSGSAVWNLLDRPRDLEELVSDLVERFDADPTTVRADLGPLLDHLVTLGALDDLPAGS